MPATLEAAPATATLPLKINIALPAREKRPDLNGMRVKLPNDPTVYLVDEGVRRRIPDAATHRNLFRGWGGVMVDATISRIPEGAPITEGAVLAQAMYEPTLYLVDNGQKRPIASLQTMEKYHFALLRINMVAPVFLHSLPTGREIR